MHPTTCDAVHRQINHNVLLLLVVMTVAGVLLAWNAGLLRSSFIRFVSWQAGRPVEVRGALHLHLLTGSFPHRWGRTGHHRQSALD